MGAASVGLDAASGYVEGDPAGHVLVPRAGERDPGVEIVHKRSSGTTIGFTSSEVVDEHEGAVAAVA